MAEQDTLQLSSNTIIKYIEGGGRDKLLTRDYRHMA